MSTWNIWCECPQISNWPGLHASGIRIYRILAQRILALRALSPRVTYCIYCNSSQINDHCESISPSSRLNIHLVITVQVTGVNDRIKGWWCHEGEQKATKRAPGRFAEAAYEEDEDYRHKLGGEVELQRGGVIRNPPSENFAYEKF